MRSGIDILDDNENNTDEYSDDDISADETANDSAESAIKEAWKNEESTEKILSKRASTSISNGFEVNKGIIELFSRVVFI